MGMFGKKEEIKEVKKEEKKMVRPENFDELDGASSSPSDKQ